MPPGAGGRVGPLKLPLRIIGWNPMSLASPLRLASVVLGLCFDILVLPGKRVRNRGGSELYQKQTVDGNIAVHSGYDRGAYTNRSAGVTIVFNQKLYKDYHIQRIWSPPKAAAGRGGAIRLVSGRFDVLAMGLYLAPFSKCTSAMMINKTKDAVLRWAASILSSIPARCLPIVCMDGNSKMVHNAFGCVRHERLNARLRKLLNEEEAELLAERLAYAVTRVSGHLPGDFLDLLLTEGGSIGSSERPCLCLVDFVEGLKGWSIATYDALEGTRFRNPFDGKLHHGGMTFFADEVARVLFLLQVDASSFAELLDFHNEEADRQLQEAGYKQNVSKQDIAPSISVQAVAGEITAKQGLTEFDQWHSAASCSSRPCRRPFSGKLVRRAGGHSAASCSLSFWYWCCWSRLGW